MENNSIITELKNIVDCYKKECLRYESIRQVYLESAERKGENPEWVHKRMDWLYDLMNPQYDRYMRLTLSKLKIPIKDKNYLWNLLQFQSLLHNYDPVIISVERIINITNQ